MSQDMTCSEPENPPRNTAIPTLGAPNVDSPLEFGNFTPADAQIFVYINREDAREKARRNVFLELAGPREKIYFDPSKAKCAIVTCGGLCPGINNVIRSIVLEAFHNYNISAIYGIRYGLEGFIPEYGHEPLQLAPDNVTEIHGFGGTILGSSRGPQSVSRIVDYLERMNISVLFMLGGDGTMRAASKIVKEIERRGVKISIICIPKTIDNDINFVSQTFGFDTAVGKATEAIRCAHTEALGAPNGMGMVKLMGREAGFIAAQASLAQRDVDFVLVPEDKFELYGKKGFLKALHRRLKSRGHAVIVVAEGAGQHLLSGTGETDASGNVRLGDICGLLIDEIRKYFTALEMDFTLKFIDPSYIIRSVPPNSNDSIYCSFLGQNAVHAAMAGKTGMVISRWNSFFVHIPLTLVTRGHKRIDTCSYYWRSVLDATGQERNFNGSEI